MRKIPFQLIDWANIPKEEHKGETGTSFWQTIQYDRLRIRIVEYNAGYLADHWCKNGHIVHCLEGEVVNEQENGGKHLLKPGMTYIVSDEMSSHRSVARDKVRLLIIDGDFLQ